MSGRRQLAVVPKRRTAPAEERREQLILATIRSVADHGLADTTIATVAQAAGLSQGIVNLHFRSKDGLLTETLRYLADEYRNACEAAAAVGAVDPVAGLKAMVELDFRRTICSRDKLAVWFAFWGERRFRPTYRRICAERDRSYDDMVRVICAKLCEQGGYPDVEPALVADGLSALTDGLWLDLLVRPESMSRERAKRIALSYLADVFPRHFSQPAQVD
ncbi:MAG TPA: transcriptional regulator BetI [Steroidobacteraceae bacterium]|nr:transcriptional regulator BetI [Steroidobacteraceae bacterium]